MKKILIVEDETIIGMDIASKLEKNGYEVIGLAVDDLEVMDYLKVTEPDLILMDISLKSSIDGIELVKEIYQTQHIPVIYLTSYSDSATIKRSMETGPYGYIIKPFTTQTLLTTISLSFVRIELEHNLRNNNDALQAIFDSTLDGIAVISGNGDILRGNNSFCKIFSIDYAQGTNLYKLMQTDTFENNTHKIYHVAAAGKTKMLIASFSKHNDGSIVTVTDITEAESFKSALNQAEQRFTTIFRKKMIPAVLVSCPDSTVYDYNDKFAELYGMDGIKGRKLSDVIGENAYAKFKSETGDSSSFVFSRVEQTKADGTEFVAEFMGNKITIDNRTYFLIDVDDITEKVKIEKIEKELNLQMIHTNKMTALGTLVSGVAHELNNPNNFIMFNSTLLNDYLSDIFDMLDTRFLHEPDMKIGNIGYMEAKNDILQLLNGTIKGSERIRDIVLDLKGFARQDSPINKEIIHINNPLQSSVRILKHLINKSTDNFSMNISDNINTVSGSVQKLEQVFLNIIINALESLGSKDKHLKISSYNADGYVVTEFEDGGCGIPENLLSRITEPFFTTKQSSGGTGLGLAIVYSIIQDHGGKMEIKSVQGQGTNIKIFIPAAV